MDMDPFYAQLQNVQQQYANVAMGALIAAVQPPVDTVHSDQPIRAIKIFNIVNGRLASLHAGYVFNAPVVRTEAPQSDGQRAALLEDPLAALVEHGEATLIAMMRPGNRHGFYAWKPEYAIAGSSSDGCAMASVDLFGKVVEHDYGYRAEAMRFVRIELCDMSADVVAAMESLYQCEVVCHRSGMSEESMSSLSPAQMVHQALAQSWREEYGRLAQPPTKRPSWWQRALNAVWPWSL